MQYLEQFHYQVATPELDADAAYYFGITSGFAKNPARFQTRLEDAEAMLRRIYPQIQAQAVISSFPGSALQGERLTVGETVISCKAFAQLEQQKVAAIYLFLMSVGDVFWDEGKTIDMLYADIWGTSYVDAFRDRLQVFVQEQAGASGAAYVSDSFGPGFYGMPVTEIPHFFQLLAAEKIGVRMVEGQMLMLPLKTLAGIYVALNEPGELPGPDCKSCLNQGTSCEFCQVRTRLKRSAPSA